MDANEVSRYQDGWRHGARWKEAMIADIEAALRERLIHETAASRDNAKRWADEQAKRIAAEKALQQAMTGLETERQRSKQMAEAFMQLHNLAKAIVGPARA